MNEVKTNVNTEMNTPLFKVESKDGETTIKSNCPSCENINKTIIFPADFSDDCFNEEKVKFECAKCNQEYNIKIKLRLESLGYVLPNKQK